MKSLIHNFLKRRGIQIAKYPNDDLTRRMLIVKNNKIDTLLDVGANKGQYAIQMRSLGYDKKLLSFEPQQDAFNVLKQVAAKDPQWEVYDYALGDENTKSLIHIADNSFSSSILNMLPTHLESAPESKYVGNQEIEIKRLDSIFDDLCSPTASVMLKIDTQGYEKNVIDGAFEVLKRIKIIQLEMSILPLYENEILYTEMIQYLKAKSFELFSLESGGFYDLTSGQLLQVDGIFVRKN
jgi:FkbM family methyltransferase